MVDSPIMHVPSTHTKNHAIRFPNRWENKHTQTHTHSSTSLSPVFRVYGYIHSRHQRRKIHVLMWTRLRRSRHPSPVTLILVPPFRQAKAKCASSEERRAARALAVVQAAVIFFVLEVFPLAFMTPPTRLFPFYFAPAAFQDAPNYLS